MNCSDARNSVTILIIEKEIDVDNEDDSAGVRPAEQSVIELNEVSLLAQAVQPAKSPLAPKLEECPT